MSGDVYPKYQLPSGNWTTDKDTADRLWARHEAAETPQRGRCGHPIPPAQWAAGYRYCERCAETKSFGMQAAVDELRAIAATGRETGQ